MDDFNEHTIDSFDCLGFFISVFFCSSVQPNILPFLLLESLICIHRHPECTHSFIMVVFIIISCDKRSFNEFHSTIFHGWLTRCNTHEKKTINGISLIVPSRVRLYPILLLLFHTLHSCIAFINIILLIIKCVGTMYIYNQT